MLELVLWYNLATMKELITQNPKILGGKPTIAGTRMSVEAILELLASGMEIKEVLKEYPFLKKHHILAAIEYATRLVGKTKSYKFDLNQTTYSSSVRHEISRRH